MQLVYRQFCSMIATNNNSQHQDKQASNTNTVNVIFVFYHSMQKIILLARHYNNIPTNTRSQMCQCYCMTIIILTSHVMMSRVTPTYKLKACSAGDIVSSRNVCDLGHLTIIHLQIHMSFTSYLPSPTNIYPFQWFTISGTFDHYTPFFTHKYLTIPMVKYF